MLRLCGKLNKNAVHLNFHKDVFCVLASFRVLSSKESLARLVSTRTQVRSLFLELRNSQFLVKTLSCGPPGIEFETMV